MDGTYAIKRSVALTAIVVMVAAMLTLVTTPASAAPGCRPYPDVTGSQSYCADVFWLKNQDMLAPGKKFHPKQIVTRAAFAEFVYRALNRGKKSPTGGYVAWAKKTKVLTGKAAKNPNGALTRADMVTGFYRLANGAAKPAKCKAKPFKDVKKGNARCGQVTWAKNAGILKGKTKSKLKANQKVTRGALASHLHRALETPEIIPKVARLAWKPSGVKTTFQGVSFLRAKNWQYQASADVAAMLSPPDSHGYQCAIILLRPQKAAGSKDGRTAQAYAAAQLVLPGLTGDPNGMFTGASGTRSDPTDPALNTFSGATAAGWDYAGVQMNFFAADESYSVLSMGAHFGKKIVPVVIVEGMSPYGNDTACIDYWAGFGPEVGRVFFSMAMGPQKRGKSLTKDLIGEWASSSGSVGNSYTFGANGRYIHASAIGGSVQAPSGLWHDVYTSWAGSGSWSTAGDIISFRRTSGVEHSSYVRVFDFHDDSGWKRVACWIDEGSDGPYSYCTKRQS